MWPNIDPVSEIRFCLLVIERVYTYIPRVKTHNISTVLVNETRVSPLFPFAFGYAESIP